MVLVNGDLAVDNERGDAQKIPLCGQVIPDEILLNASLRGVVAQLLRKILRVKDLKVRSRQGDPVAWEEASCPQSFLFSVSVFQIVGCRDLKRHLVVGKKITS